MSKGPKGPRNPMGWGNDDPHTVKRAGESAWKQRHGTMHGSTAERRLAAGKGALVKWSGERVRLDDKPGDRNRRP